MDVNIDTAAIEPAFDDTPKNARSWKYFVGLINGIWRKGAADYIACGRHLIEAKDELQLQRDSYNAMLKKLDFSPSVAKKLICIARNETLSSHVNCLPHCYSTLYCLSQLSEIALEAAIASGEIHPGMMRKDATALMPVKTEANSAAADTSSSANSSELAAAWQTASQEQRRAFLDKLGRAEICGNMSRSLLEDLSDHVIGLSVSGASESSNFARYATNLLHTAFRCAEQPDPDDECKRQKDAALVLIVKRAEAKGIARSNIVIAEGGKSKKRK